MFLLLVSLVLLSIRLTTSTISLSVYTKASESYTKLCPLLSSSTNPKCSELKAKVDVARDNLLAQALEEGEAELTTPSPEPGDGQGGEEQRGDGQDPQPSEVNLVESALEILSLSKEACKDCNSCPDIQGPVHKIIGIMEGLGRNHDSTSTHHLTIVFSLVAAALFILITAQLYNCIRSCIHEKRSDRHVRSAREARVLYNHLSDIHIQRGQERRRNP